MPAVAGLGRLRWPEPGPEPGRPGRLKLNTVRLGTVLSEPLPVTVGPSPGSGHCDLAVTGAGSVSLN